MRSAVYENEPFKASPEHTAHLAGLLGGNLQVGPEGLRIIRVAGSLRLPDRSVLTIRSRKAPLASLLTWAAYAYPELDALRHLSLTQAGGDQGDVAAALARVLCDELGRAVQTSGLLRHYRRQPQTSAVIRGRIDFARMARMGANLAQVPCVVFARLPNTPLNALFAAALDAIRRNPSMRAAAGPSLGTLTAIFAEIQPRIDRDLITGKLPLSRLERPFAPSLALALLLTGAHGLREGSNVQGLAFLINLANLFERSVARALVDELPLAQPKTQLHYHRGPLGHTRKPAGSMEIDVLIPGLDHGRPVVIDAKYKTAPSSANLQQMVSYCWLTGARQAVLVFPSGMLGDNRQPFHYRSADGSTVTVHLVEMQTEAVTIEDWRAVGRALVERIRAALDGADLPARR